MNSNKKKTLSDSVVDTICQHPVIFATSVALGIGYGMYKLQEHCIYKAVLKANIHAVDYIR